MLNGPYTICDNCGTDLTVSTCQQSYRTVLHAEPIPPWDGELTAEKHLPEPRRPFHFCDMVCVAAFIERQRGIRGA